MQQQTKWGDLVSEGSSSKDSPSKFSDVSSQKPNLSFLFLNLSFHYNSLNLCNFPTSLSVISSNADGWSQHGISCQPHLILVNPTIGRVPSFSVKRKGKLVIRLQQKKKSGRELYRAKHTGPVGSTPKLSAFISSFLKRKVPFLWTLLNPCKNHGT